MATNYKKTVQDVLQVIADKRGESSVNSDASRIRAVSKAEQDFALRKFWNLFLLIDQTTTGDGSSSSFSVGSTSYPMREKGLSEIFVGGTTEDKRTRIIGYTAFKNEYNRNTWSRIATQWYDAANDAWKIKINPVPADSEVITYSYFWVPPTRTATTDPIITPDINIVAYLALAEMYESEEEDEKVLDVLGKAEALIGTQEGIEEAPAVGQIITMGTQENSIRSRGIGSY